MIDIQAIRDNALGSKKAAEEMDGFPGAATVIRHCDTIGVLCDEVERLREDYRDLAWQSCPVREDGVVDSCAIPAYA